MNLQNLYNKLSINDVHEFISSKQEENLTLDFKTISNANLTNKDDKKISKVNIWFCELGL